ncbi:MAG: hypothetical protein RL139_121 [Gemmatimonadota bacterium]
MTFLAPWALVLAAAAGVPLVLHLWRRRATQRVEFPAVRYLRRMQREHAREVTLQNLLLMLLRVGIVLALALAAARPVGPLPGASHAPTAVALVLDNSLSAQAVDRDGPMLARLVGSARAVVAAAAAGDRLWLVTLDGTVAGGDAATLDAALAGLRPLDGAGDAPAALRRAAALVRGSGLPSGRVVVLTDAQATTWQAADAAARDGVGVVLVVPPGTPGANRAVTAVAAEPLHWDPRGAVRATIVGDDSASWRLVVSGRTVARGTALPGASVLARAQTTARGWVAGAIELAPDELRGDDVRHFAVHVGEPPAVVVDAGASPFLRGAVAALAEGGRIRRGDGVLLASAERARRPALLFAPADPVRVAEANRALERAGIPWRFGARREGPAPLVGIGVDGAVARSWYRLTIAPGASAVDTVARVGGEPWAVAGEDYVLVASAAEPTATDLPVRAAFVPWLDQVLAQRLASGTVGVTEAAPGAMVRVPARVDALEGPEGRTRPVVAGGQAQAPWTAGVSFWRRAGERVGALVVNAEPQESDAARLAPDTLAARLGETVTAAPSDVARAAFAAGGARALARTCLVLALLLLAVEWIVATRGIGRRAAPAER